MLVVLKMSHSLLTPFPDCKLSGYIYRTTPERDPSSSFLAPYSTSDAAEFTHDQSQRQCLRPQHPSPPRRIPLLAHPPPTPNPQQQRPGPARRNPNRRRALRAPRKERSGAESRQRSPLPRDRHLRAQPPRERQHDGVGESV